MMTLTALPFLNTVLSLLHAQEEIWAKTSKYLSKNSSCLAKNLILWRKLLRTKFPILVMAILVCCGLLVTTQGHAIEADHSVDIENVDQIAAPDDLTNHIATTEVVLTDAPIWWSKATIHAATTSDAVENGSFEVRSAEALQALKLPIIFTSFGDAFEFKAVNINKLEARGAFAPHARPILQFAYIANRADILYQLTAYFVQHRWYLA